MSPALLNPMLDALSAVLVIPAAGAVALALLPGYWLSARLNLLGSFATLLAAVSMLLERPVPGTFLFVDDLNIVFVVLTAFVAFSITTMDSATRPMPASMVGPTPTTVSIVRWMPSRTTIRRNATGITTAFSPSAMSAVM